MLQNEMYALMAGELAAVDERSPLPDPVALLAEYAIVVQPIEGEWLHHPDYCGLTFGCEQFGLTDEQFSALAVPGFNYPRPDLLLVVGGNGHSAFMFAFYKIFLEG